MNLSIQVGGRERRVEFLTCSGQPRSRLDGHDIAADVSEVAPGVYSILLGGAAFEVRIESKPDGLRVHVDGHEYAAEVSDPRHLRRDRRKIAQAEGQQEVVAPMPGRIVRILIGTGETVETGQGLMVVEAMKMQNEIKSPKAGKVERLLVREGQAVNSGETLAIVA